jgi:UDP-N-acetylmuramoyl-tripeptide--D-alanyl-D-alanine ligase
MRAALEALVSIASPATRGDAGGGSAYAEQRGRRRTWAVLGRMGELGATSAAAHAEVAGTAAELGVDELVTVDAPDYRAGRAVADVTAALALLRAELEPGDVVLVKASRAAGLDRLATALLSASENTDREPVA